MSKKTEGQYMTPDSMVALVLDSIGYKGTQIIDKKVMEPSFGDGAFLFAMVERILDVCDSLEYTTEQTLNQLQNVYGFEKDTILYNRAIARLNSLLASRDLPIQEWKNLENGDTLLLYEKYLGLMDFVIGNPPYVRVHNIDKTMRQFDNFECIEGTTDLYIVFYEIGIRCLNAEGKLIYITPMMFLTNKAGAKLRRYISSHRILSFVYDFKSVDVFEGIAPYVCVCALDKGVHNKGIVCRQYQSMQKFSEFIIDEDELTMGLYVNQWGFVAPTVSQFLKSIEERPYKLGQLIMVQQGLNTNKDDFYIGVFYTDESLSNRFTLQEYVTHSLDYVYREYDAKVYKIETLFLRPCIKATKPLGAINQFILYPYIRTQGHIEVITETAIKGKYPAAYKYLMEHKSMLLQRDISEDTEWYAYGRSQGIVEGDSQKLIIGQYVSKSATSVSARLLDESVLVYGGVFLTYNNKGKGSQVFGCYTEREVLEKIKSLCEQEEFVQWVKYKGIEKQGDFVFLNGVVIKQYGVTMNMLL